MTKNNDVAHRERAHALLSASGSSRWLNCTPSAVLEDAIGEGETSIFAEEGTLAHEIAETKCRGYFENDSKTANRILNKLRRKDLYHPEMDDYTDGYLDYVREIFNETQQQDPNASILTEFVVNLSAYIPQGFGTIDNMIIGGRTQHVIDLKYGKGIKVSARDNSQLKLYSLGALENYAFLYDVDKVIMHIYQPRLDSISVFEMETADLLTWGKEEVQTKADMAFRGEGEQVPGDWCTFCKVKNQCRALAKEAESIALNDFQDPNLLTDQELLEMYAKSDRIVRYLSGLGKFMLDQAIEGKKWKGFKLVAGRSNRQIVKPDAVTQILLENGYKKDEFMKSSLEGIGALEKLLTKETFAELLNDYVIKPEGKPTLVKDTDKRPEISHLSDFE